MIQDLDKSLRETSVWHRMARDLLLKHRGDFQGGTVALVDADGTHVLGDPGAADRVTVWVRNPQFYRCVALRGTLGAAESWMNGDWDTSNLMLLIRLMVRNLSWTDRGKWRGSHWGRWRERWQHWWRGNSRRQAQCNIRAHYDLGNDFFALFLDPSLNYSSAIYRPAAEGRADGDAMLAAAQTNKMDRICRQLALGHGQRVLEIGTGWGAWACHAAKHYGCEVVTTTISPSQARAARERVERAGLARQVTVLERDYRDVTGKFDRIASVEMIEAVGEAYYDTFFECCGRWLKSEGLLLLQAITIVDSRYRQHVNSVDFICKYIFPGGSLPCISTLVESASRSSGLRLLQYQEFSQHYVETLVTWRRRFMEQLDRVRQLGFDERFIRMWDFYLTYCAAGFQERQINVGHLLMTPRRGQWDVLTASPSDPSAFPAPLATDRSAS